MLEDTYGHSPIRKMFDQADVYGVGYDAERAARKPVQVWKVADLGLDAATVGAAGARAVRERLFAPSKVVQCEFIEAATPEEQGVRLAARLREVKVL